MGGPEVDERRVVSTVWGRVTLAGAAVTVLGAGALAAYAVVRDAAPPLALTGLVAAAGLGLVGVGLWAPRSVQADPGGLRVSGAVRDRVVPWADLRRVRSNAQGVVQVDTHLELVDGRLVELPGGVRMGTVERWRRECGGAAAEPETGDRRTLVLLRQTATWPLFLYLPVLLNTVLGGLGLVTGLLVWAVALVLLLSRPRPRVVATPEGLSVPTWRGRRDLAWDAVVRVRGRADRWDPQQTVERRDGTTLDLPIGLTAELVEQWRSELHRPGQG